MKLCPLKRQLCNYADYSKAKEGVCSFNGGARSPRPLQGREILPLLEIKICPKEETDEKQCA